MRIAFTICSNNYLAQAKALGDSITKTNPGYKFFIGLVDTYSPEIDYSFFQPHEILPASEIGVTSFDELWKKYNIIEFNTCVKASFFKYFFKTYQGAQSVFYLDPDIAVYHSLAILETELEQYNVLLTPHIFTPIPLDGMSPTENHFLNYGIYNLGFIAINRECFTNSKFLDWWEERLLTISYSRPCEGIFVDQLWINLVPIFFEKVKILSSYGFNAGPWNLHERTVTESNAGSYNMNDGLPLYFYHFSNFKISERGRISNYYERYSFEGRPHLKTLYNGYYNQLINNKVETLAVIKCAYMIQQQKHFKAELWKNKPQLFLKISGKALKAVIPPVILKLIRLVTKLHV